MKFMQDSLLLEIHISKSFCEDVGKFCLVCNLWIKKLCSVFFPTVVDMKVMW